jgi:hypothetical protein
MKPAWLAKLSPSWRARMVRLGFNFHPAFRGTGGRVVHVAKDLRHIRISLSSTKNPQHCRFALRWLALHQSRGASDDADGGARRWLHVWDRAASISYRKPGYTTLYADFSMPAEEIAEIHRLLKQHPELDRTYRVELKDEHGTVHTVVERTVYIADKNYYRQKNTEGDKS